MSAGRRASITEDVDARTLLAAVVLDGRLPTWTERYVLDAFVVSGYVDPAAPGVLTEAGMAEGRRWAEIKSGTGRGFARDGAFTPVHPADERAARREATDQSDWAR